MNSEKSLKSQNALLLWTFLGFNIILFWSVNILSKFGVDMLNDLWRKLIIKDGAILAFAPLVIFILNGILSAQIKATLVFWRHPNPLPGSRVFSKLAYKDARVNLQKLSEIHGELPTDPIAQNELWYKIYIVHRPKSAIKESHKNYLLSRDMTGFSVIFMSILPIASLVVFDSSKFNWLYLAFMLIQFLIISHIARNYGNRFVCNVLAEESSVD